MTLEHNLCSQIGDDNFENEQFVDPSAPKEESLEMEEPGSSRRRKGKPKKCVESTLANGSTSDGSIAKAEDSGIGQESSLSDVLADLMPSTSVDEDGRQMRSDFESLSALDQEELFRRLATGSEAISLNDIASMITPQTASIFSAFGLNSGFDGHVFDEPPLNGKKKSKRKTDVKTDSQLPPNLPQGFEEILQTANCRGFEILNGHGHSPGPESSPPKKRREVGRCETKATVQTADGVILDEQYDAEDLQKFVKQFKILRNKYGFTQGDVGSALGRRYGAEFSQTTISRFEALNLSFKNMCKLKPLLEEWLDEVEKALERGIPVTDLLSLTTSGNLSEGPSGTQSSTDFVDEKGSTSPDLRPLTGMAPKSNSKIVPPLKKRRKRTNLDVQQKLALDTFFQVNPRPDYVQITDIANQLNLDNDVVRVWFCNRRQKMRKID